MIIIIINNIMVKTNNNATNNNINVKHRVAWAVWILHRAKLCISNRLSSRIL